MAKNEVAIKGGSVLHTLAQKMCPDLDPSKFTDVVKATCIPSGATNEQFAAFLMTAQMHGLNPITKEIYAFPAKGGGIQPVVGIDGWVKMANSHPQFDGMEYVDSIGPDGDVMSITCSIYRKDRRMPTRATEYMEECRRNTEPWKTHPRRMLRHKATIQAIRLAFGFAGVADDEEYQHVSVAPVEQIEAPAYTLARFLSDIKKLNIQENIAREAAEDNYNGKRLEALSERELVELYETLTAEPEADISPDEAAPELFDGEDES